MPPPLCQRRSHYPSQLEDDGVGASRSLIVDYLRGAGVGFVLIFHIARDLAVEDLITVPRMSKKQPPAMYACFLAYVFAALVLCLLAAPLSLRLAGCVYIVGTWYCVTRFKALAFRFGVSWLVCCLGMSSAMSHARRCEALVVKRSSGSLLARLLVCLQFVPTLRLGKLGLSAIAITALTRALSAQMYIAFGVLHMLFVVTLLHLPFLAVPPALTALVACALHALRFLDMSLEPEAAIGRPWSTWDYHPVLPNLPFALWGIVAHACGLTHLRQVRALPDAICHRWPCVGRLVRSNELRHDALMARLGQWALLVYVAQQPLVLPVVKVVALVCSASMAA